MRRRDQVPRDIPEDVTKAADDLVKRMRAALGKADDPFIAPLPTQEPEAAAPSPAPRPFAPPQAVTPVSKAVTYGSSTDWHGAYRSALRRASVLGVFQPRALLRGLDRETARQVRSALSRVSDVERGKGGARWRLHDAIRRDQLNELYNDPGALETTLAETEALAEDKESQMLRRLLQGEVPDLNALTPKALRRLFNLANGRYLPPEMPSPKAIRREISNRAVQSALETETQNFVGRRALLETLYGFATRPDIEDAPVTVMSGIGGVGKSTLLARLRTELNKTPYAERALVVDIDFDRPGFGPQDELNLTLEITRQLSLQRPDVSDEMSAIRAQARETVLSGGRYGSELGTQDGLERALFAQGDVIRGIGHAIRDANLARHPILLILDTFEEVQAFSDDGVEIIAEWVSALHWRAELGGMRVIVSGRTALEDWPERERSAGFNIANDFQLEDLERDDAAALLERLGWEDAPAQAIAERFGGNPLVLSLLTQFLNGPDAPPLEEFLTDNEFDGAPSADRALVQGMLYDRILGHIRDPRVRKLAHPGLVLRRVTLPVLRDVLAPVCLGERLNEATATEIFEALKRERWLVRADEGGTVLSHRKDIRRVMLSLISVDPKHAETLDRLNRAAITYYEAEGGSVAAGEALYHRMMIGDGSMIPALEGKMIGKVRDAVGADLDALPPLPRAQLKSATGQTLTLLEAGNLDDTGWVRFAEQRGSALVASGRFAEAVALGQKRSARDSLGLTPLWLLRAQDAAVAWRAMVDGYVPSGNAMVPDKAERESLSALAHLRLGRFADAFDIAENVVRRSNSAPVTKGRSSASADMAAVIRCASYAELARRGARASGTFVAGPPTRPNLRLSTSDILGSQPLSTELQRWMFLTESDPFKGRIPATSSLFRPNPKWLDTLIDMESGDLSTKLRTFRKTLQETRGPAGDWSATDLLSRDAGAFAAIYTDAFVQRQAVAPETMQPLLMPELTEFRAPLRTALLADFSDEAGLRALAEIGARAFDLLPPDLAPDRFAKDGAVDPAEAITLIVAFADRARVLPEFAIRAQALRPEAEPLKTVTEALALWVRLHMQHTIFE